MGREYGKLLLITGTKKEGKNTDITEGRAEQATRREIA